MKSLFKYRNIHLASIILLIASISGFSCKKYLEEKPRNNITNPSTIVDLQGLLDDANGVMNVNVTPCYGQISTDEYFVQQNVYNSRPTFEQMSYVWTPSDYYWDNDWSKNYAPVFNSNYCLEMIEKIPINGQNELSWKNVKGSALFFRAYCFLNLLWNYSNAYDENTSATDLGIVLRLGSDFNAPSARSNVKQSYDQVIKDAKESIDYLPNIPLHVYRPSKAASYGLLARAYLSMRVYDSALKYSNLSLGIKSNLMNYNSFPLSTSTANTFAPFNVEVVFHSEMSSQLLLLATSRARVDTALYSTYENGDRRKSHFYAPTGGYHRFKGNYASPHYFSGIATDEMFLIRAECYARRNQSGDLVNALSDLNNLLITRWNTGMYTSFMSNDANVILDKILLERRKELFFRGLRWIDLKRLNKEGRNIVLKRFINSQEYTLMPNANYYALPLPTDIIDLANIPQNPYP